MLIHLMNFFLLILPVSSQVRFQNDSRSPIGCFGVKLKHPIRDRESVGKQLKGSEQNKRRQVFTISDALGEIDKFIEIECIGECPKPIVELSSDIIDFGMINIDDKKNHKRQIKISNESQVTANVQFLIDCECSAWNISPKHGTLAPGKYLMITISFKPRDPAPYFRKVPIIIDGADPKAGFPNAQNSKF